MAPDYEPPEGAQGPAALRGDEPFTMQADGKAWLYAPAGLVDGPLPTHYEPHESPFANPLYAAQQSNPARQRIGRRENPYNPTHGEPGAEVFPYVATTYRLTEHHTAGGMSRWLPHLAELQPEMFCEVSPALARERGLEHGGWMTIVTTRTAIEARVMVTDRMTPLTGRARREVHQVGLPYHWGSRGHRHGRLGQRPARPRARPQRAHRRVQGADLRRAPRAPPARGRAARARRGLPPARGRGGRMSERVGFFTDTSVCIGCKACEVACKEWNDVPEDGLDFTGHSYDNTGAWAPTPGATSPSSSRTATARCAGSCPPTCASTAPRPPAWRSAPPARSSAPSSAPSSCSRTSATAAATASRPARTASSTGARRTAAPTSAPSATTA